MTFKCVALFAIAMALAGCAAKTGTTTTTPAPPQITVSNAVALVAEANDATVHAVIAARNAGTISEADTNVIETATTAVANAGLQVTAELNSADTWEVQKPKLLAILQSTGLAQLQAHVSAAAYAIAAGLLTAVNTLSVSLGGPSI